MRCSGPDARVARTPAAERNVRRTEKGGKRLVHRPSIPTAKGREDIDATSYIDRPDPHQRAAGRDSARGDAHRIERRYPPRRLAPGQARGGPAVADRPLAGP